MATIFGGDEINALVIDVGTYQCRAGYAGARARTRFLVSAAAGAPPLADRRRPLPAR